MVRRRHYKYARSKKRSRFGAVTGRKLWADGFARYKNFNVSVQVMRGAGTYVAVACPKGGKVKRLLHRCGEGKGRTVTSASAAALRHMASRLK